MEDSGKAAVESNCGFRHSMDTLRPQLKRFVDTETILACQKKDGVSPRRLIGNWNRDYFAGWTLI